jgi:hypothetical protein
MDGLLDEEWLHYSYVGRTETWKVVLLSLNINPKFAELEKDHYAYFRETTTKVIRLDRRRYSGSVTQTQIQERYEIVENRKYEGKYSVGNYEVEIQRFVEFAARLNLKPFPKKFLTLFQKEENLTVNIETATKPTNPNQNWSINYIADRVFYSKSLTEALEHYHSLGGLPPSASDVLQYLSNSLVEGLVVDLKKRTLTYPTQRGVKVVDLKNLADAISRRIN